MRSTTVVVVTSSPGRASAHRRLRAKRTAALPRPLWARDWGCSMFAEANTSALAPPTISSRSRPEAPNSDRGSARHLEGARDLGQGRAKTARRVQKNCVFGAACRVPHGNEASHREQQSAHHAAFLFAGAAFGKKSCLPSIL